MKKIKKTLALSLALAMGLSLAACGKDDDKKEDKTTEATTKATDATQDTQATDDTTQATDDTQAPAENSITSMDGKFTVSTDGWEKIYAYSWDDDFQKVLTVLENQFPELKDYIEYVNLGVSGTGDEYKTGIDTALTSGDKYPSLIPADNDVAKYWLEDASKTASLASIGITDDMYADAYNFSKGYATYNGELRAATWQGCPGVFTYRRDIAQEVFGVSEPADVQALLKDWDSFFAAADKLKEAGKFIVSGPDDIKYAVWDSQKQPWVTIADDGSEKLTLDDAVTNYLELAKRLYDGDYTKKTSAWGSDWYANMSGDVLGYFGTTWFMGQIEGNCGDTFGNWAACTGPSPYHWGGTYVMVGKDTPNPDLCAFVIYELCCDADLMYKLTTEKGDFVNNRVANAKLVEDGVAPMFDDGKSMVDMLGGQNPIQAWADAAEGIDLSNTTYADSPIKGYIDAASTAYNTGEAATVDDAIAMIKKDAETNLGLIVE